MYTVLLKIIKISLLLLIIQCPLFANNIYGVINNIYYMLGQFDPAQSDLFISLKKIGIPTDGREQYLRKEAATALKKVFVDFKKQYPKVKLWVASTTRTYSQQKIIWESKWNNEIKGQSKKTATNIDMKEIHLKILKYSSMPGTSRHHWGTDVDFNVLVNSYYDSGDGKIIYRWMKQNMNKYGFCQVYNKDRKNGYQEERWHWTYMPLAKKMTEDWIKIFSNNPKEFTSRIDFNGSDIKEIFDLAVIYVSGINPQCR